MEEKFIPSFKTKYLEEVAPALNKEFGYKSVMQIPALEKITLSVGVGEALVNKKLLDAAVKELEQIAGQHVLKTKARKSISTFKLREGNIIGVKVTLRGKKMYDFMEKLINITLPRSRDFQGIKLTAVDSNGNFNLGIKEHIIFPEISPEKSPTITRAWRVSGS